MAPNLLNYDPLNDPDYTYGTILPIRTRTQLAIDELPEDISSELAFPEILRAPANAAIRMGQRITGQRELNPNQMFLDAMDITGGSSLLGSAPVGALGSGVLRRTKSETSPYDLPAGSKPEYRGAQVDRSGMSFLRYKPKKNSPRVEASLAAMRDPNNPARQMMLEDIQKGLNRDAADWYNTEELRDWFVSGLGEAEGDRQYKEFINLIGATSPGSKVPPNIRNASGIRARLYDETVPPGSNRSVGEQYREDLLGIQKLDDARPLGKTRKKGYGHKTQGLQELIAARQLQGGWSGMPEGYKPAAKSSATENPKPKGFSQSLLGSEKNMAADLHFTRYMAMASRDPRWLSGQAEVGAADQARILELGPKKLKPYFQSRKQEDGKVIVSFNAKKAANEGKITAEQMADLRLPQLWADKPNDNEYAAFEDLIYDMGQELGLTGPQLQAALWMGAAERTGVDVSSQKTFMDAFRAVADDRAAKEGMTRAEVIDRFIKDKGLLSTGIPTSGLLQPTMSDEEFYAQPGAI